MPKSGLLAAIHRLRQAVVESDQSPASQSVAMIDIVGRLEGEAASRPGSYPVHEQLSILWLRQGDLDRSLAHARAAVEIAAALDPAEDRAFVLSGAYANLAAVHGARSELGQEWDALQAGLRVRQESGCLNYQLAVRLAAVGDLDAGLAALALACRDPRSYPRDWFAEYARRDEQLAILQRDPRFQYIFSSRSAA